MPSSRGGSTRGSAPPANGARPGATPGPFPAGAARSTDAELEERFHQVFGHAVERALPGDDAVSLSGGVASPAGAGSAAPGYAKRGGRRLGALSGVFPDLPAVDESAFIELVAG